MTSHNLLAGRRLRLHFIALVAGAGLVLSGCNAAGDPGATDTPSASATQTTSPSATPTPTATPAYVPASASGRAQNVPVPVLPEVAKTETKAGLEAFVRHWYEVLDYSYETGDSTALRKISQPGCLFCSGLSDGIAEAWSDGRWVSGGHITTPAITATMDANGGPYAVVQVIQESIEIRNADGSLHQAPTPATNTGSRAAAKFGQAGWVLTDLGLIR